MLCSTEIVSSSPHDHVFVLAVFDSVFVVVGSSLVLLPGDEENDCCD